MFLCAEWAITVNILCVVRSLNCVVFYSNSIWNDTSDWWGREISTHNFYHKAISGVLKVLTYWMYRVDPLVKWKGVIGSN